jgi:FG-GAP repeat
VNVRGAVLVSVLALTACAAPASFDGLAGGTKEATEDAAVEAPRPVSPVSVSLVASSRPRLKWALGSTTLTGAIVEMSQTRDFKEGKRFEAKGTELVVPEDLALGVWFWRLKGTGVGTVGTTTSAVWEMVVRGPAKNGSSDAPTRSMVDMNGDGEADLLVAATVEDSMDDPEDAPVVIPGPSAAGGGAQPDVSTSPIVFFYPGSIESGFSKGGKEGMLGSYQSPYEGPISIGGGTDFDGDGYTDIIEAGTYADLYQSKMYFSVTVTYASKGTDVPFDLERGGPVYLGPPVNTPPSVREGADVDGDGYGDAVVGLEDVGFLVLGGVAKSMSMPAVMPVAPGYGGARSGKARIAMGSFDANGDGLGDVAFSYTSEYEPTARAFAAAGDRAQRISEPKMIDAPDAKLATAFAAGDFNGDGIDDVAITTPVGASTRVCIWYGHREKLLTPGPCVGAAAGDQDFGGSLTAVDLEGDGVDELLATAKAGTVEGVRVVRIGPDGAAATQPIGVPGLGVRLTTIWPGRPGKARWAAVAADGTRIGIFEGTDLKETLTPPPGTVRGFGRGIR